MSDDADAGGLFLLGESATNDEPSAMQKRIDELSAQRATAAKVLEWLEADSSFEAIYGPDSKQRHVAVERERMSCLDAQIARCRRSLEGWQLVNTTELGSLLEGFRLIEGEVQRKSGAVPFGATADVTSTLE